MTMMWMLFDDLCPGKICIKLIDKTKIEYLIENRLYILATIDHFWMNEKQANRIAPV